MAKSMFHEEDEMLTIEFKYKLWGFIISGKLEGLSFPQPVQHFSHLGMMLKSID